MINTILVEVMLAPIRLRLAIKELMVKRLERIAVLYQRSSGTDAKVTMPSMHSNALESLKSSINSDKALIARQKGESPPPQENSQSVMPESGRPRTESGSLKPLPERDKRKSRRKSYLK